MRVGPTIISPSRLAISGASARAISSEKTACSISVAPRPPYSSGQWTPAQPASYILRCQARRYWNAASGSFGIGSLGTLASSQSRMVC